MADKITKEQRSKVMKSIKSQSQLENLVSKELWKRGFRYRKNDRSLFGKPDISIKKYKVVIFIDSCFWHFCEIHGHRPKTNQEYWDKKLNRNIQREAKVKEYYTQRGWHIIRIWEHSIKEDLDAVIDELSAFILKAKDISVRKNI
ncbi:very short patch repair endonuclease [Planococcus sp. YIM B11945]|uniref:very short patch repair endonuclease n=1 Tax=Planococcus sp. YIM B11945 TaxID=3435410 RepID=UPI003D7E85B1